MGHLAAWINEKQGLVAPSPADTPSPGPNELLIKVNVIGFSPIESKVQK